VVLAGSQRAGDDEARRPAFGETTYRLTDITRGEPDASLFELPAGVTIR